MSVAHALLLHGMPLPALAADWTLDLLEDVNDNPRWKPFLGHLINEPSEGEGHPNVEWIENLDVRPHWCLVVCRAAHQCGQKPHATDEPKAAGVSHGAVDVQTCPCWP